jgi:hypothetical protein
MRALILFCVAIYLPIYTPLAVAVPDGFYVWDGSFLRETQTCQGLTCSNWAIWYFKHDESQTPGSQWGASIGSSPEEVLQDQRKGQKDYEDWAAVKTKYHLKTPDDTEVYDNYLGPICVTSSAFDAKLGAIAAIESAGELAGRISDLIAQIRKASNDTEGLILRPSYRGFYIQEGEKSQLEEYLNNIREMAEHVHKLQAALMQHLGPTMMQINGDINTISKQLDIAENGLPAISKFSPTLEKVYSFDRRGATARTVSTAWMNKIAQSDRVQTSIHEIPGGFVIAHEVRDADNLRDTTTRTLDIQFNNIDSLVFNESEPSEVEIEILLKVRVDSTWIPSRDGNFYFHTDLDFSDSPVGMMVPLYLLTHQDAQDSFNFLKAQIQQGRTP